MCSETRVGVLTEVDIVKGALDETENEKLICTAAMVGAGAPWAKTRAWVV